MACNVLFLHQNYPGQYKRLAQELGSRDDIKAVALGQKQPFGLDVGPVRYEGYSSRPDSSADLFPPLTFFSEQVRRGDVVRWRLRDLKQKGFSPDICFVHPGWGEALFLMNSDIMVLDPAGLRDAAEAIRARGRARTRELVVGFSLLYEDHSIQHIGMEFPRSSLVGNLRLADHPMKGLPFALYDGERILSVPAVTGALMGLSSSLFDTLGGFDPVYERGDFEDADLCLRARQRGAEIQLHVTPGLYHLERQSIPGMGDSAFRSMITHMNCVEFNDRWDDYLSREPAEIKEPPLPRAQGRKPITIRKRNAV